ALGDAVAGLAGAAWRVLADLQAVESGTWWCGRASATYVAAARRYHDALVSTAAGLAAVVRCWQAYLLVLNRAQADARLAGSTVDRLALEHAQLVSEAAGVAERRTALVAGSLGGAAVFGALPEEATQIG